MVVSTWKKRLWIPSSPCSTWALGGDEEASLNEWIISFNSLTVLSEIFYPTLQIETPKAQSLPNIIQILCSRLFPLCIKYEYLIFFKWEGGGTGWSLNLPSFSSSSLKSTILFNRGFGIIMTRTHGISNQAHLGVQKASGHKAENSNAIFILFLKNVSSLCHSPCPLSPQITHRGTTIDCIWPPWVPWCLLGIFFFKRKKKMSKIQGIHWKLKRKLALIFLSPSGTL